MDEYEIEDVVLVEDFEEMDDDVEDNVADYIDYSWDNAYDF